MRTLLLLAALSFALPAAAQQDDWKLAVQADGTYYAEAGVLLVFAADAELTERNRCISQEDGGSFCLFESQAQFSGWDSVKLKDIEGPYRIYGRVEWVDDAGKKRPKKKKQPVAVGGRG